MLVLLSLVQVPNKCSYRPKPVTLAPSLACVGIGSIWVFIGISTSFFSLGHFLLQEFLVPSTVQQMQHSQGGVWATDFMYVPCQLLGPVQTGIIEHSTGKTTAKPLPYPLPSSFGTSLSLVDLVCHWSTQLSWHLEHHHYVIKKAQMLWVLFWLKFSSGSIESGRRAGSTDGLFHKHCTAGFIES